MRTPDLTPQSRENLNRHWQMSARVTKSFVRNILPATRCNSKIFPTFPPKSLIRIDREGRGYLPVISFWNSLSLSYK